MAAHRIRLSLGLGVSVLALALTGCAAGPGTASSAADPEVTPSQKPKPQALRSRTASPHPTTSPSPTGSSAPVAVASESPTPGASTSPRRPGDRLLTAAEMPGLPDGSTWRELSTRRTEGKEPFGTCHEFAMTSIGAMSVVVREFDHGQAAEGKTAGHLVADFADERTARRAVEVLKSWRAQCDEELAGYDWHEVGGFEVTQVPGADAGWYLLGYGPPPGGPADSGYVDAQGVTRVGRRVAVLEIRTVSAHSPRGEHPMVEALRAASEKLD